MKSNGKKDPKQGQEGNGQQEKPKIKLLGLLGSLALTIAFSVLLASIFLAVYVPEKSVLPKQLSKVFQQLQSKENVTTEISFADQFSADYEVVEEYVESEGSCDESQCSLESGAYPMGFDVTPDFGVGMASFGENQATQESGLQEDIPASQPKKEEQDEIKWWKQGLDFWHVIKSPEEFDQVTKQDGIVIVDYYAVWCNGCKRIHSDLNAIAEELSDRFKFAKVNVDGMRTVVHRESIKSLPYIQVFRNGQVLFGFQAVPWKVQQLKRNLELAVKNPGKGIELDENGIGSLIEISQTKDFQLESDAFSQPSKEPLLEKFVQSSKEQREPRLDVSLDLVEEKESPEKDSDFKQRKQQFLQQHGEDYGYGGRIEELYANEVAPRMGPNEHYMDYTGSSVYCNSQLKASIKELESNMFGNPHSANPSSKLTEERVEEVRDMILRFFGADPAEYQAAFTKSATGALQIVGETFPWSQDSTFRYLRENHNSVLGMREYALKYGGKFDSVDEEWIMNWVEGKVGSEHPMCGNQSDPTYSLFAFPGEDNFAGVKYPLSWIKSVQKLSHPGHKWLVLLDAAAYVPTQPLNLSETPADFVAISFYKMFGYPTGIGALIFRTEHSDIIRKTFWGGGAVSLVTSQNNFRVLKCKPHEKLEDGTVAFLDIINLKHGFNLIEELGGIERVQAHVRSLTKYLYERLRNLEHSNGRKILEIFGKHHVQNSHLVQGGILNFEVITPSGQVFSYKKFESEAAEAGFHVRTGAECNPGACYKYLGVEEQEIQKLAEIKQGCSDDVEFVEVERSEDPDSSGTCDTQLIKVPLGSVRTSLGYMSTFEDCEEFARFVESNYKDREC